MVDDEEETNKIYWDREIIRKDGGCKRKLREIHVDNYQ